MKKLKKVLALLLSLLIVLAFAAGCSGNNEDTSQQTPSGNNDNSSDVGDNNSKDNGQDQEEPYEFKFFTSIWPAEKNEISAHFLERMEKENNVKINWELPPQANYNERLQIMLAGGDYPDVVNFMSHTDSMFLNAVKDGVVIPITEYVQNAPNMQKFTYDVSWDAVKVLEGSDDIYMIPRTTIVRHDGFILRQDWLDNVGLSLPEDESVTLEEFAEILRRFTKNDPNKNGNDDTYGISLAQGANGSLNPIVTGAFDVLGWQKYDGEEHPYMNLQYSRRSDNYKKALEFTANLWKEGLIDPDWPVNKAEAHLEKLYRGEVGVVIGFAGHVQARQDSTKANNPEAKMTYLVGVKNEEGKVLGASTSVGVWGGWSLTKNAKNPQKIVDVFDWMLSDEAWDELKYGPEGVTYNIIDGKYVPTDRYNERLESWNRIFMRRNDDPSFFLELSVPQEERIRVEAWIDKAMEACIFSLDRGYRPPIMDDPEFIDAQDRLAQAISKIIVGDMPVADYDKALDDWYNSGGEEYVKQMNEHLSK